MTRPVWVSLVLLSASGCPQGPPPPECVDGPGGGRLSICDIQRGVYSVEQLRNEGRRLYEKTWTVEEGLGNALSGPLAGPNPRPNARKVHHGRFGGPDSMSCTDCHIGGGYAGSGTADNAMLQDGDGANVSTALVRDGRMLWGLGWLQLISGEFRTDLPFGWKGRAATIAAFVEGGFQVHFGMASTNLVAKHKSLISSGTTSVGISAIVGNGQDPSDPDSDGVRDEVTMGEIAAVSLWLALQPTPIELPPQDPALRMTAQAGKLQMSALGCTSCHTQSYRVRSSRYVVGGGAGGWSAPTGMEVDLHQWAFGDQPVADDDGTTELQIWSDLKVHDMGPGLEDSHDTFGVDALELRAAGNFPSFSNRMFLTTPLWGIAVTPPYLHDGRAATILDAILAHGGEAQAAQDNFARASPDTQQSVITFLETLTWRQAALP